jgi:uncharacterized protein YbaR (Trm112 family)
VYHSFNSGKKLYSSNLSKLLSDSNGIIYRNNLFIPMDNKILKLIFCPDCDKDFEVFSANDREEYPASCRFLTSDEYYLNYTNAESSGGNSENITLESGFITVENKIKNLYIDEEGKVFGFNFDKIAVSSDGDTVYGLYG